jgi:hypothetical protein
MSIHLSSLTFSQPVDEHPSLFSHILSTSRHRALVHSSAMSPHSTSTSLVLFSFLSFLRCQLSLSHGIYVCCVLGLEGVRWIVMLKDSALKSQRITKVITSIWRPQTVNHTFHFFFFLPLSTQVKCTDPRTEEEMPMTQVLDHILSHTRLPLSPVPPLPHYHLHG